VTGPEGSVSERIRGNLEGLGLDAMASSAPEYSRLVATGAKSFPEALPGMTDAQVAAVRERGLGRRIEKAGFPYAKTPRDFDFSFQPSIPRGVVEDLATLGFLDRHENVVPVGSPGVGKAHIAVALGVEAVRAREPTHSTDCQRLVSDLAHAAGKGQLERRLRFYAHLSLPIVDEVGYLDVDKQGAGLLFQLVSRRHEGRSTIVTTNVGMGSWAKVFGDPVVASAIADRLCHHCRPTRITGRPHRTKDLAPQDRASPAVVADSGAPR
jgi:DNA replication protein DnaC